MDTRFDYRAQMTADHMAHLQQVATARRMRRAASTATIATEASQDPCVSRPRHSWWQAMRGHRTVVRARPA